MPPRESFPAARSAILAQGPAAAAVHFRPPPLSAGPYRRTIAR